jgi:hypothetical protein
MFLISVGSSDTGIIGLWYPMLDQSYRYLIIENTELAVACYNFLRRHGARQFNSEEEVLQAMQDERWPGWDKR